MSYGGSDDLWGETWSPTELNEPGFGVALRVRAAEGAPGGAEAPRVEARYDDVRVGVYYCE